MNVAKPLKLYTVEEFELMEKEENLTYELIDGVAIMSPRLALKHQLVAANLHDAISPIVKQLGCYALPKIELALDNDYIVPDMSIICDDISTLLNSSRYKQAPLIVMSFLERS
jgi:Uma2 family endonuclease